MASPQLYDLHLIQEKSRLSVLRLNCTLLLKRVRKDLPAIYKYYTDVLIEAFVVSIDNFILVLLTLRNSFDK